MLTPSDLVAVFELLHESGYRPPWADSEPAAAAHRVRRAAAAWAAVLGDLDPDALQAAVLGWLRSGSSYWPKPGEVLRYAPTTTAKLPDAGEMFDLACRHAGMGYPMRTALARAKSRYGAEICAPYERAIRAVGGLRALGAAPIDLQWGGNPITRAGFLRDFREAWTDAAESLERRQLAAGASTKQLGVDRG